LSAKYPRSPRKGFAVAVKYRRLTAGLGEIALEHGDQGVKAFGG